MAGSIVPCIFCGEVGRKLTKEHVYPEWLRKVMNIRGDVVFSSGDETVRTSKKLDVQLRDVCDVCNSNWLNDLEAAFRSAMTPTLFGLPVVMSTEVQRTAAAWAIKTWLLIERAMAFARSGRVPVDIPLAYFDWIRMNREPPPMAQVWIGGVDAMSAPPGKQVISFLATQWVGTPPDAPVGLVGVFTVGDLLFSIYNPVRTTDEIGPQGLGIKGGLASFLTQIWPTATETIPWPPASVFAPEDLRRIWPDRGIIRPGNPPSDPPA